MVEQLFGRLPPLCLRYVEDEGLRNKIVVLDAVHELPDTNLDVDEPKGLVLVLLLVVEVDGHTHSVDSILHVQGLL